MRLLNIIFVSIIILVIVSVCYSCSSNFNGFYRQTTDTKYQACAVKNKESIEAIETQCIDDGQKQCRKHAVAWVCERSWRK